MYEIPVFKAEQEAGLAERVRSTASIAYASKLSLAEPTPRVLEYLHTHAQNEGQPDLHYLQAVLVTTGWNKNDDVFDLFETWAARNTPEDKPVNIGHNCKKIVGHMTGSHVINDDGEPVEDGGVVDDLPAKFHIIANSVLYKEFDADDLREEVQKIIAEIEDDKWFVSMEALFRGFDYALITSAGEHKVVARNEDTAFLTKHLRCYGGEGIFDNAKIGRLLRNFVFSGKGLVEQPANPESIILSSTTAAFVPTFLENICKGNALGYNTSSGQSDNEETQNMDIEKLTEKVDELETALTAARKENEELKAQATTEQLEELNASLAEKDEANTKLQAQIDELKTSLEDANKTLTEAQEAAKTAQAKMAEMEAAEVKRVRLDALVKAGLSEEDATAKLETFSSLNDEQFAAVVALVTPPAKPEEDGQSADAEDTSEEDDGDAASALDGAEPNEEANASLATGSEDKVEQTRAALSEMIQANFLGSPSDNKE